VSRRGRETNCLVDVETCLYNHLMSPKELTAFRLEPEIMDGLRRVKDRDGIPFSIQVDRALRAWLEKKRVSVAKPKTTSNNAGKRPARRTK
jgi:hypothetical protein